MADTEEAPAFGRYRLIELLGQGGMGEVWRAHDTLIDRTVAIKMLLPHFAQDERFDQRFRREARAAARLDDPHVVPIHDVGEIDGRLYVAMRLVNGADLQTLLDRGPLEPRRAVAIIDQVAKALNAAHKVGLIHRDIKPSNILVADDDFAYLIDFGIARAAGETGLTSTGATIGTWSYMAPERFSTGQAEASSDIYALACVLYQCLTGELPFPAIALEQIYAAHLSTPPPRPSAHGPGIFPAMDNVIATGLAKDPRQRYPTTVALANAARDAITVPTQRPTLSPAPHQPLPQPPANPVPTLAYAFDPRPQPPPSPWAPAAQLRPESTGYYAPQFASPAPQDQQIAPGMPLGPGPATSTTRPSAVSRRNTIAIALTIGAIALVVIIAAAIGISGLDKHESDQSSSTSSSIQSSSEQSNTATTTTTPTTTTPTTAPPVAEAALQGLLLSPEQIAAGTSPTPLRLVDTFNAMLTATFSDPDCSGVLTFRDTHTYANTGWTTVLGNQSNNNGNSVIAMQFLVLFSSAHDAQAFFAASAPKWQACSNRQLTVQQNNTPKYETSVKSVTNTNGMLSATLVTDGKPCEHALTVANNVVVDASVCKGASSVDNLAVNIARQIAAKVPTT